MQPLDDEINALPDHIRRYIHDLETRADPAGDVRRAHIAEEKVKGLEAKLAARPPEEKADESGISFVTFGLPEDVELLAALGRLSIRHGQLDLVLRRTVKTLAGLSVREADDALAYCGSRQLRDLIKRLANKTLGKAEPSNLKLQAILTRCERVTERRNTILHCVWTQSDDGSNHLFGQGGLSTPPTAGTLNQLADDIFALVTELNDARLHGFLLAALIQKKAAITDAGD